MNDSNCRDWPRPLPEGVVIERYVPAKELNLSALSPERKAEWWDRIKNEQPALAELLSSRAFRAFAAEMQRAFDAEICIDLEDFERGEY